MTDRAQAVAILAVKTAPEAIAVANPCTREVNDRLAVLFDAHHGRLYRLARRMSRDAEAARDLVQETFLRAARRPGSIPAGHAHEEAWLVRVLVNLCRDRWRQRRTRQRLTALADGDAAAESTHPEPALIARALVWQALAHLAPRRRAVLVMSELEGISARAIARTLGVTQATVRWHLSLGRRELARAIAGARSRR